MELQFRKATFNDVDSIWIILKDAISKRKEEGSSQWQDGYPNREIVKNDIVKDAGFVLTYNNIVIGYSAVLINDEPEYANIIGNWLTNGNFVVVHRIAISKNFLGNRLSQTILKFIEKYAISELIYSIKVDTNFDNAAMLKTFDKLGYIYCGEVYFRGSVRKAYEKVLLKPRNNLS